MAEPRGANRGWQRLAATVLSGWALCAAQPVAGQEPVDGVCDESVRNGCAAGTANDAALPDTRTLYLWRCDGEHGGADSEKCSIRVSDVPVDGVCDETVRNGCAAGTANDAALPDTRTLYLWRCDGEHGGADSEKCSIRVSDVPVDGVCDESVRNGCAAGTANDAAIPDSSNAYLWRCDGLHGGENSEKCLKFIAVDGGWSDWSACSATACGAGGTQTRTCNDPVPARGGQECLKLDGTRGTNETRACTGAAAVDGGWSSWSACSVSVCGATGTQTRTCDNPAPGCGGSVCSGPSSRACGGSDRVDGGWSDWSACSATACGASGTQTRACTNPTPACGGSGCAGASSRTCTGSGPRNGGWSAWSACSATACGASGTQTRACTNPTPGCGGGSCAGASSQACTGNDPVDGVWATGPWGRWSACGGSICSRSRSRTVTCTAACGGAPCDQSSKPAETETSACPSPAWTIGRWSAWSECSETTCGETGQQTRTRTVTCPCGTACPAPKPASSETEPCTGDDPRDGVWSDWSACSETACGARGTQTRVCNDPTPGCGGRECSGSTTQPCLGDDPRDGVWKIGPWGPWGTCSPSTCKQSRTKPVSCALPGCGGADCVEESKPPPPTETQSCTNPPNPRWVEGSWGAWGDCSAACNAAGHKIRNRTVTCQCGSSACPDDTKPAERITESCVGPPCDCPGQTLTWGDCSADATTTRSGSSVTLNDTSSCRSGSATFTCNAGTWIPTNVTCTVTPETNGICNNTVENGCAAGTLQDVADTTTLAWEWKCLGICEGDDVQCRKLKVLSVSISVSSTSRGRGTATATVSGGTRPYTYSWSARGASIVGSSTGASITFSYRSSPATRVIDFSVNVRDSAQVGGSAEHAWGTPPGG